MARTQYLVLSTQYRVLLLALAAGAAGCAPTQLGPDIAEPSFAEQLRAVQADHSPGIHVTASPIGDNDLAGIVEATALRMLLVDHPDSRITAAGIRHLADL